MYHFSLIIFSMCVCALQKQLFKVCVHCVFVDSCADDEGLHVFCICVLTEFYSEVKCWLCVVLEWLFENMSIIRINKHSLDTDWSFPALCFIMTIKAFYSILFIKCSLLTTRGNQSVCIINTSFLAVIKAVTFLKKRHFINFNYCVDLVYGFSIIHFLFFKH